MKGAWKKVTGNVLPDSAKLHSRRNSKEQGAGAQEGASGTSLLSKLRQTVASAQMSQNAVASLMSTSTPEKKKVTIWPEWNDADINVEKWDSSQKGKEDKKGKSPVSAYFEDPDGKLELPASLRVAQWKRPQDFFSDKNIVVVEPERMSNDFDLITNNEHLHESGLLRYFISQVTTLWELCVSKDTPEILPDAGPTETNLHTWRPWEHIYSLCKTTKNHIPLYNPHGKYAVRLYWMGCWRKILVDDLMPFDENDQLLLPVSTVPNELWPMLLAKAIIKIASLDYNGGNPGNEFGDVFVIHCLTGWLPEAIPLHSPPYFSAADVLDRYYKMVSTNRAPAKDGHRRQGHINEVWELLRTLLPEWRLPEPEEEKENLEPPSAENIVEEESRDKEEPSAKESVGLSKDNSFLVREGKQDSKEKAREGNDKQKDNQKEKQGKERDKGAKEDKKEKKEKEKQADKDKKDKAVTEEPPAIPPIPEVVMFATFGRPAKYPVKISMLGEMADASEKLRQNGLSHLHPHPVCLTQTRCCPLEPPPPPEVVPAWKLIRPRKKKEPPTDEPKAEVEPPKDIQCLEISSPFVNYRVSPVPIPTETYRSISCLERGYTHTHTECAIEEVDENAEVVEKVVETPPPPPEPEPELPPVIEESAEDDLPRDLPPNKSRKSLTKHERFPEIGLGAGVRKSKSEGLQKRETSVKGRRESKVNRREDPEDKKEKTKLKGQSRSYVEPETSPLLLPDGGDADIANSPVSPREEHVPEPSKQRKRWMDFDQFCICFRTLFIFHKPNTYLCNQRHSDLKSVQVTAPPTTTTSARGEKKQAPSHPVNSSPDEKSSHYLFMDSLKPTEIVIAFSVLPRWFDNGVPSVDEKKVTKCKEKEIDVNQNSSVAEGAVQEHTPPSTASVTPGTLLAEPFSWKSFVMGEPILRLRTTGTRAVVLSLPPGRHVLKFIMSSPLAHHVHMCSTANFVFGDEETVLPYLVHESSQFKDSALQVVNSIGRCITHFSDPTKAAEARQELVDLHCPFFTNRVISKRKHFQLYNDALYSMLKKAAREVACPEIALAWRAFTLDLTSPNILGLPLGPQTAASLLSTRGSSKGSSKKNIPDHKLSAVADQPEKAPESSRTPRHTDPTPEELVAVVKIQKVWKGHWTRKVMQAHTPGTAENIKAQAQLQKSWTCVEQNVEENSLNFLRDIVRKEPEVIQYYPFHKDEWNKVCYTDYKGSYTDQPANTWFLVFREIFYVKEETLVVPRLSIPLPTCMLRVIDNDTGRQLPSIFQKVAPYVFNKRNKKGYTFVAEARSLNQPLIGCTWKMRLIGSSAPLPTSVAGEVNCSFHSKEIHDLYVPDPKNIMFRYAVKATEEQLCSIQLSTSKTDVHIRLSVIDGAEELASATGKGHVVIPAFVFGKEPQPMNDDTAHSPVSPRTPKGKRSSLKFHDGRTSRSSPLSEQSYANDDKDIVESHKYIIQATVLKNSWPLSDEDLQFIYQKKDKDKNEQKSEEETKEKPLAQVKSDKTLASPLAKVLKAKIKGDKADKGDKAAKEKQERPVVPPAACAPVYIDRPSWTLRVVVDSTLAEDIELKKDTERADEIRAMKKAWEDAEPGRAAKALQSRHKYLSTNVLTTPAGTQLKEGDGDAKPLSPKSRVKSAKLPDIIKSGKNEATEPSSRPLTAAVSGKVRLRPLDITPFIKKTLDKPRLLDEIEMKRMTEDKQKQIAEYKDMRRQVEVWRSQDQVARNFTKIKQLDDARAMQLSLDLKREAVNVPREAFRQVYLAAERKRLEELAQQEEALRAAEQEARNDKSRGKSAKGKKKK